MLYFGFVLLALCALTGAFPLNDDERIVGGRPADIMDFPHQVSVQRYTRHMCGGSILNENWVLTAAHCFKGMNINQQLQDLTIRAGSTTKGHGGVLSMVSKVIENTFSPQTMNLDFALMKLATPLTLDRSKGIDKIKLASFERPVGTRLTVSGWGRTLSNPASPINLRAVDVSSYDRTKCDQAYSPLKKRITPFMICAYAEGKDACQGDSGGPLIDPATNELVGVVSFGYGCANPGFPGVYSNVVHPQIQEWIRDNIAQ